jgi:hypothetical protein
MKMLGMVNECVKSAISARFGKRGNPLLTVTVRLGFRLGLKRGEPGSDLAGFWRAQSGVQAERPYPVATGRFAVASGEIAAA